MAKSKVGEICRLNSVICMCRLYALLKKLLSLKVINEELMKVKKAVQTSCFQKCKQNAIVKGEL